LASRVRRWHGSDVGTARVAAQRHEDRTARARPPVHGRGNPPTPAEQAVLDIQRTAGNAAVAALFRVQREGDDEKKPVEPRPPEPKAAEPETPHAGGPATTEGTKPEGVGGAAGAEQGESKEASRDALTEVVKGVAETVVEGAGAVKDAIDPLIPTGPAAPGFGRDPGCDIEAPAVPTAPAARTFTPDPTATLPPKEVAPDLSMIPSDKDWWDDAAAKAFGEKLADCYASRGMTSGAKVDRDTKLAELKDDFNQVVRGWFGRTGYGRWDKAPDMMATLLQRKRTKIMDEEKKADAKLKKEDRRSQADLDSAVEKRMQKARFDLVEDVRNEVAKGTWGWMAERREKLDFDTVKQKISGARANLAELLTSDEEQAVVRQILVDKKKELTAAEIAKVHEAAQKAADAAAKKAGKASAPLTDDEKAAAVAKAERERVKAYFSSELGTALIKARTTKDAADLMVPTKGDVAGWDEDAQHTRIHKDIVALMKVLEGQYKPGFSCGTYRINVEGDHASAGFQGRFRSLDMYPKGGASRMHKPFGELGFFDKQVAYDFAMAIDRAVAGKGTFQILYNDFPVARELNKVLKNGRVMNIDNVVVDKNGPANLNWHGPLVTHFHVDFAI
jgi:hypothetical protein